MIKDIDGVVDVIKKILAMLNGGMDFSDKAIARELGLNEEVVRDYKFKLEAGGYIKKEDSDCNISCGEGKKCSCCSASLMPTIVKWSLTEKGKNAINL